MVTKYLTFSDSGGNTYVEDVLADTGNRNILKVTIDNGEQELSVLFTRKR